MPSPAVNPYNKDEIEYRESGFDYAPQYPGTYNYNQSGIQYNESNFTYVRRDVTISADTIGCSADLSPVFTYVYTPKRPGGVAYSNGYDYNKTGFDYNERDTSIPDTRVLVDYRQSGVAYSQPVDTGHSVVVIATPATIGITAAFSATPSVPATVTPATIACPAVLIASVTANSIAVHGGVAVSATLPSPTISATVTPAVVATQATLPGHSLFITVDATPSTVAGSTTTPSPTPSGNYTATPTTIGCSTTVGAKQVYSVLVMPTTNTLPSVGVPEASSRRAYALMRHFSPRAKGANIFIISNSIVQDFLPSDASTVTRWIYGGHESPRDLTSTEETLLVAAGYSFDVRNI